MMIAEANVLTDCHLVTSVSCVIAVTDGGTDTEVILILLVIVMRLQQALELLRPQLNLRAS